MGNIFRMASSLGIIQDIAQFVFKMVLLLGVWTVNDKVEDALDKKNEA